MNKGVFYSVGVGPGDPSLMTLKAVQTIRDCDVIISPDSGGAESMALKIAEEYIEGKRVESCPMPMIKDSAALAGYHDTAAARIGEFLDEGLNVAFLTLGDPCVYSTAMYVHSRLEAKGYETRIVPGVTSFCAAAAALNIPLCERGEQLHIIPESYKGEYLRLDGTRVLMKPQKAAGKLAAELKESGERVYMVTRASMEDEKIFRSAEEIGSDADYFSVLVVKPV